MRVFNGLRGSAGTFEDVADDSTLAGVEGESFGGVDVAYVLDDPVKP
jgi:hypothetical protein